MFCGVRINLIQINAGGFASGGKADIAGSPSWAKCRHFSTSEFAYNRNRDGIGGISRTFLFVAGLFTRIAI
jgi:hypothetical protein